METEDPNDLENDKQNDSPTQNAPRKSKFSVIIALASPVAIPAKTVIASLRRIAGDAVAIEVAGPEDQELTLLTVNGLKIAVLNLAYPCPIGTFDRAADPNMLWPDAKQELAGHRAHILMTPAPEGHQTRERLVSQANTLALVAAAISAITPAIGVYWPASENLVRAAFFIEATIVALIKLGRSPVEVFIRLYPMQQDAVKPNRSAAYSIVTHGLRDFVWRELEVTLDTAPLEIALEQTLSISNYLVDTPVTFANGETLNVPTFPKSLIVHTKSKSVFSNTPVYKISLSK